MRKLEFILPLSTLLLLVSCKNPKVVRLEQELLLKTEQAEQLEEQLEHMQSSNTSLLDRLSDLSVVNKAGAESIQKSLENMTQQYSFIQDLTRKVQSKDSLNLALVMNLKRSLSNIDDEDVQVEVRGGRVHVSISDKLLFRSGSARITDQAQNVLAKIAAVINDHYELDVNRRGAHRRRTHRQFLYGGQLGPERKKSNLGSAGTPGGLLCGAGSPDRSGAFRIHP